ncbi:unnamed protein product [Urochloa decumbens]|uniref:Exocyst subunit Exo70 family protein n=1 Tax=Urochloa decumbens TaxID=240449 RepID=A0ABC9GU40_9POAL
MKQYGGGMASVLAPAPAPAESLQVDYYTRWAIYRDSIRRVSVSGDLRRSPRFFLPVGDSASATGEEEGAYCWSSASSASFDTSARGSSVSLSSDGDLCFSGWGAAGPDGDDELRAIARQMVRDGYTKRLIRGFSAGGSSSEVHYVGLGPDLGSQELLVLGSWFSELDVEWVLHTRQQGDSRMQLHLELEDGCASLQDLMGRWIKALKTMVQVFHITHLDLRAKTKPAAARVGNGIRHFMLLATGKMVEREQELALAQSQFTRFAEVSLLRMLDFVEALVDAALNDDHAAETTLPGMFQVYTCVVDDSPAVLAMFDEAPSTTSTTMFDAMNGVYARKRDKLSDAIRRMMEKVKASFLRDSCYWRVSLAEAGGVHKATTLMMNYVMLLSQNEGALSFVLHDSGASGSVLDLFRDLISCWEKQLERAADLISDPGLRYVFLMNNCSFISKKLSSLLLPPWTLMEDYKIERPRERDYRKRLPPMQDYVNQADPNLRAKIETDSNMDGLVHIQSFIEAYLDVSWEPVMSCLNHGKPHGFLRGGGTTCKFESEFWRTYDTQKLWKVPNPELRKRLRKAIIEKVISGYSKYLAERTAKGKSTSQPNNTPHELEQALKELFEG